MVTPILLSKAVRMTIKPHPVLAAAACLALLPSPALAQPANPATAPAAPASPPTFELADVHVSAKTLTPDFTGGALRGDRYLLHNATMVNIIALSYGVEDDNVLSGPAWLDLDRFDISARAPRGTSPDDVKLMLRALLGDRFHLVAHNDTHPLPAFVLTVAKGGSKLKQSDGTENSGCNQTPNAPSTPPGAVPYIYVTCHNLTLAQIADSLHDMAGGYLTNPVVDQTGITGSWDFDIKWTGRGNLQRAGGDGISIFDAVDKQLGLKLEAKTAPMPVVIVDSVDQKPTPNAPGLDKALPPPPPAEFDVAVLKPSKPDERRGDDFSSNQITATGLTLKTLIAYAWQLNPNDDDLIANAPKWLGEDKWDILAKAAPDAQSIGPDGKPQFDFDLLPHMVQALLEDRFQMKSHLEDRPIEAFTLVAVNPHMKKADPINRTGCKEGPGPDGKDPRIANPILGRLLYCQNMTMAQLADRLPSLASGYVFTPVLDSTGLKDAYDFTLSFSTAGQLRSSPPPPSGTAASASNDPSTVSDPNGGLSLLDAMAKQLGVKVIKEKRPSPVLVIDHIEEHPTDN
jgi:uncharacterized protein (TIGR03435 family)